MIDSLFSVFIQVQDPTAIDYVKDWVPTAATILFFCLFYFLAKKILNRQARGKTDKALIRSIILFFIVFIGIIAAILSIPMEEGQKGQITSLIGIVLSAVLGLSATSFIGNALAGISLKMRGSFKPGDFISVNGIFGRVTQQGLFHTEIQNTDRDLTTLPNLSLASNSVKVTRASGTFIQSEVSLGYDVHRAKIDAALKEASMRAGLRDGYVHLVALGDYSIVYRIHGFLEDVKTIHSSKSKLNGAVVDCLHEAGIEIVSPTFMNQRQIGDAVFIAKKPRNIKADDIDEDTPEDLIFDKAKEAEEIEKRKEKLAEVDEKIKTEKEKLKEATDKEEKQKLEDKINKTKEIKEKLEDNLDKKVEDLGKAD